MNTNSIEQKFQQLKDSIQRLSSNQPIEKCYMEKNAKLESENKDLKKMLTQQQNRCKAIEHENKLYENEFLKTQQMIDSAMQGTVRCDSNQ